MAKVHIRKFQDGRMIPHSTSYTIVDIYFNEYTAGINENAQGENLVCIHWDDSRENMTTFITITQPDWKHQNAIDRELRQSLIKDRKLLHAFLKDIYHTLGAKLISVTIRPPVFAFIHSQSDLFIKHGKQFMDILRQLISNCLSTKQDIKVKTRVNRSMEPCTSLQHVVNRKELREISSQSSDRTPKQRDKTQSPISTEQRFAMIDEEMSKQKDFMEKQFSEQRKQHDDISATLERVLEALQNEKNAQGDQKTENSQEKVLKERSKGSSLNNADVPVHASEEVIQRHSKDESKAPSKNVAEAPSKNITQTHSKDTSQSDSRNLTQDSKDDAQAHSEVVTPSLYEDEDAILYLSASSDDSLRSSQTDAYSSYLLSGENTLDQTSLPEFSQPSMPQTETVNKGRSPKTKKDDKSNRSDGQPGTDSVTPNTIRKNTSQDNRISVSRSETVGKGRSQMSGRDDASTATGQSGKDPMVSTSNRDERVRDGKTSKVQTDRSVSSKLPRSADSRNRETATGNTSESKEKMLQNEVKSGERSRPKKTAQKQSLKEDRGVQERGVPFMRTDGSLLRDLQSHLASSHMTRQELEARLTEAGMGFANLQGLIEGLCQVNPDEARIWTAVQDQLTKDKEWMPRAEGVLDTILCMDTSGSIGDQALREMKNIVSDFITGIEEIAEQFDIEENIGLVTFGGIGKVLHSPTNDYGSLRDALETMTCGGKSPLLQGSLVALTSLTTGTYCSVGGPHVLQRIIFITDGKGSSECDESGPDIFDSSPQDRMRMVSAFGGMGNEFGALNVINFVWVPIGNADRSFLESMASLTKGQFVDGNEVRGLCRFQRIRKTAMSILEALAQETADLDGTHLDNLISALASEFTVEEKDQIKALVLDKLYKTDLSDSNSTDDFTNINLERGLPPLGSRVIRGPDWKWEDQGLGAPGTIINHAKGGGSVYVVWDDGHNNIYRYGNEGAFDVLPDDDCPRQFRDGQKPEIGVQVERGPDWQESYGKQDGGPGSHGVIIRKKGYRVKIRWENGNIHEYRFGENDKYDLVMRDPIRCLMESGSENPHLAEKKRQDSQASSSEQKGDKETNVWQRLDERGEWQNYSEVDNDKMRKEFTKGKNSCLLSREGKSYRVCFNLDMERSIQDNSTTKVRRIPAEK